MRGNSDPMKTNNPDITWGLFTLRRLHERGRIFLTPPKDAITSESVTLEAREQLRQIGQALFEERLADFSLGGRLPPAVFIISELPALASTTPLAVSLEGLRSLFVWFEEELEPTPISV